MHYHPAFDMSWYASLAVWGMMAFPFIVIWTLFSESIALFLLKYDKSFWRCLGHTTIINLVSGVAGAILQIFVSPIDYSYFVWVNSWIGSPPIDDYQTIDDRTTDIGIIMIFVMGWIGSIIIEGLVLLLLRRKRADASPTLKPGNAWVYALRTSCGINSISYIGLIVRLLMQL